MSSPRHNLQKTWITWLPVSYPAILVSVGTMCSLTVMSSPRHNLQKTWITWLPVSYPAILVSVGTICSLTVMSSPRHNLQKTWITWLPVSYPAILVSVGTMCSLTVTGTGQCLCHLQGITYMYRKYEKYDNWLVVQSFDTRSKNVLFICCTLENTGTRVEYFNLFLCIVLQPTKTYKSCHRLYARFVAVFMVVFALSLMIFFYF